MRERFQPDGNLLWVGVRSNLPPLVDWVNDHPLPGPLDVLTNLEDPARPPTQPEVGFRPGIPVTVHDWTPQRHIEMTAAARAPCSTSRATTSGSRHKPPAKGIDFIASGVPLAMNPDSSTAEHLARMGFDLVDPAGRRAVALARVLGGDPAVRAGAARAALAGAGGEAAEAGHRRGAGRAEGARGPMNEAKVRGRRSGGGTLCRGRSHPVGGAAAFSLAGLGRL